MRLIGFYALISTNYVTLNDIFLARCQHRVQISSSPIGIAVCLLSGNVREASIWRHKEKSIMLLFLQQFITYTQYEFQSKIARELEKKKDGSKGIQKTYSLLPSMGCSDSPIYNTIILSVCLWKTRSSDSHTSILS